MSGTMGKRIILDDGSVIESAPDDACIHGEVGSCYECDWERKELDRGDHARDVETEGE